MINIITGRTRISRPLIPFTFGNTKKTKQCREKIRVISVALLLKKCVYNAEFVNVKHFINLQTECLFFAT